MSATCTPALPPRRAIASGSRTRAVIGGGALLAAAIVVGRRIDVSALTTAQIAWGWIAASLVLNLASILGKAVVWKLTLEALPGGRRTRYAHVVPAQLIGFLLNAVLLARVGEVARIAVLARRTRLADRPLTRKAITGTVIAEQLLVGAAPAITVLVLVATCDLPPIATRLASALIAVLAAGGVILYAVARSARGRLRSVVDGIVGGNAVFTHPGAVTAALAAGTASWFAQIAGIGAALVAFGGARSLAGADEVGLAVPRTIPAHATMRV